jgi:MFS family permease
MVFSPVAGAYVADLSPAHLRGRYSGAWGFTWGIGLVLAPSLGALLYSVAHPLVWLVCLGCGVVAAALVLASPKPSNGLTGDVSLPGEPVQAAGQVPVRLAE